MRLCGQQAVWNYEEENGLLTIQGVGAMEDYTEPEQVPWNSLMQEIKVVVIRDGITTVGDCRLQQSAGGYPAWLCGDRGCIQL